MTCCQAIGSAIDDVGCCVNILNVGGLVDTTGTVEENCANINNIPGNCGGSTISGAMAPTIGTLLGALAVLMAIMLQGLF